MLIKFKIVINEKVITKNNPKITKDIKKNSIKTIQK